MADPIRDTAMQVGPLLAHNPSLRNFAPRVGFSWSPIARTQTLFSGGFGIYYDQLMEYMVDNQKTSAPFYPIVVNTNFDSSSTFPNAVAAAAGAVPQARTLDHSGTVNPVVFRFHFTIQQQLPGGWNLRSSYVGARGNHLFRSYEINLAPVPIIRPDGSLCFPPDETQHPVVNPDCPPVPASRAGPVNPAFGGISLIASDAQSFYNSLQLSAGYTINSGSSVQASYNFSKSVDDASRSEIRNVGAGGSEQYGLRRTLDRSLSDFDIRHRLSVSYFYTAGLGRGPGWISPLLRHWRLGGIITARSGTPFTPTVNLRSNGYLFTPSRPNLAPGRSNNPVTGKVEQYFDPTAFSIPPPGTPGNLGRNTIISARVVNADLSVQRDFSLGSNRSLQFRADIFNLANHPSFNRNQGGSVTVFTGNSTQPNAIAGKLNETLSTARQLQLALRFSF